MSTLYEIDRAIMNCCNQETGEMIDQEALDALMMQSRYGRCCWTTKIC